MEHTNGYEITMIKDIDPDVKEFLAQKDNISKYLFY